jgi:hypothetical protein
VVKFDEYISLRKQSQTEQKSSKILCVLFGGHFVKRLGESVSWSDLYKLTYI